MVCRKNCYWTWNLNPAQASGQCKDIGSESFSIFKNQLIVVDLFTHPCAHINTHSHPHIQSCRDEPISHCWPFQGPSVFQKKRSRREFVSGSSCEIELAEIIPSINLKLSLLFTECWCGGAFYQLCVSRWNSWNTQQLVYSRLYEWVFRGAVLQVMLGLPVWSVQFSWLAVCTALK